MNEWYIHKNAKNLGPFSEDEIVVKIVERELTWLDLAIAKNANSGWTILEQIPEFRARFGLPDESSVRSEEQWFFLRDKEMKGPWTLGEARKRLYSGLLSFDDQAWRHTMKTWGRIGDLPEFAKEQESPSVSAALLEPEATEVVAGAASAELSIDELSIDELSIDELSIDELSIDELLKNVVSVSKKALPLAHEVPADASGEDLVGMPEWMRYLATCWLIAVLVGSWGAPRALAAGALEIVPMKLTSEQPVLVFQTDAKIEDVISVKISGASGEILELPSLSKTVAVTRKAGEVPTLNLAALALPKGRYTVEARVGELASTARIFLGANDAQFTEALEHHKKMIAGQQQVEKLTMFYTTRALRDLATRLEKNMHADKQSQWREFYAKWRGEKTSVDKGLGKLLKETKQEQRAYPERLSELKAASDQLHTMAEAVDGAFKQLRKIASQGAASSTLAEQQREIRALRMQKLQPLLRSASSLSSNEAQ